MSEYLCNLSPELQRKAEAELNERPQWRDRDVLAVRQMVLESADLQCPTDYSFLLRFLRAKKFDYDRAFAALRRYYVIRGRHPEIFENFFPSSVSKVLESGIVTVLPQVDNKGRRIVWFRPGLWEPDSFPLTDIIKTLLLNLDWMIRDEPVQINGIALLTECSGLGWKHFKHMNKERVKMITYVIQEAFPVRLKAIHILNAPTFMQQLLSIIRLFLKEKLKQRIYVHGSRLQSLLDDIGHAALPTQYGGQLNVDPKLWSSEMLSSEVEEYFKQRLGDGYVDAARKLSDAGRRHSNGSVTLLGTFPLLSLEQQSNGFDSVKAQSCKVDSAFTSVAVCQASTDSD